MKLDRSLDLQGRADRAIAHGALTNSKRPDVFVKGVYPTHIKRAYKTYLEDVDGNTFLDTTGALGTNLFGYGNPDITAAVSRAAAHGVLYSLASEAEVLLAERMKETFSLDRVRFLKTGSEGCSAAVRIARAFTGKSTILSEGYHGWHDLFTSLTPPANGVADSFHSVPVKIGELSSSQMQNVAAVIIEPLLLELSPDRVTTLEKVRDLCQKEGALLIFDETITAYRVPGFSISKMLGIRPDLWVGGKALAGGLPLSVVGGRADAMECDYFVSGTWSGDTLAIAAALEASRLIRNDFRPEDLWEQGGDFLKKFNAISPRVQIKGYNTRGVLSGKPLDIALFMQESCIAGTLFGPSFVWNKYLHPESEQILSMSGHILKKIENGTLSLKGNMPRPPFSARSRA